MRFTGILSLLLLLAGTAQAACPAGDTLARSGGLAAAIPTYIQCALYQKDDATQLYLGQIYEKGRESIAANPQRALLFYQMSADNGNASAQVNLAQLLTTLDETPQGRETVIAYHTKLRGMLGLRRVQSHSGGLLHPYALLMLAAEKPENKWFYPSKTLSDTRAAAALKAYQIDPAMKKDLIHQASQWKQYKMRAVARDVYPVAEYNKFYETLYPKSGIVDAFARSQEINKLKKELKK